MKNNFIIFVHHYNELDMILPFIDYILKRNKDNLILYSDTKNLPGADYHLEFLKTQHNIKPRFFLDEQYSRRYRNVFRFRDRVIRVRRKRKVKKKHIRYISYIVTVILLIMIRVSECVLQKPIKGFVDKLNVSDIIMVYLGGENIFPFNGIVKYAEKRSIKTVAHSHGFSVYSNLINTGKSLIEKSISRRVIDRYITRGKRVYCDYYLAGRTMKDTWYRSTMLDFKELDRVYETCTPRYTKGWTEIFRSYLMSRNHFSYGDKEKLNVVFFLSHLAYNVNRKALINTLHELSRIDNINFVYKPHTRGNFELDKCNIKAFDASDINSIILSAWADVGIVFGCSIGMQLLLDNVPVLVPSYVHTNTTIFEEHKICITANSLEELVSIFSNNTKSDIVKLVDNRRVEDLINKLLDGNKSYDQLMQEYYEAVVDNKHFE
jgi:hypothetical protein